MRALFVLVLLIVGVVAVGYYKGWFDAATRREGNKTIITAEVDRDKIERERAEFLEKGKRDIEQLNQELEQLLNHIAT